jgi:hypothetical protein
VWSNTNNATVINDEETFAELAMQAKPLLSYSVVVQSDSGLDHLNYASPLLPV